MTDPRYKIFIDTSAWIAHVSLKDSHHAQITPLFSKLITDGCQLITSSDVVTETITFLRVRLSFYYAQKFWQFLHAAQTDNYLIQIFTDEQTQAEAWTILEKYSDHHLSLTDATSMAIMNRFNLKQILTLDHHFAACGLKSLPKLPKL